VPEEATDLPKHLPNGRKYPVPPLAFPRRRDDADATAASACAAAFLSPPASRLPPHRPGSARGSVTHVRCAVLFILRLSLMSCRRRMEC
jgi:hypothetical protein